MKKISFIKENLNKEISISDVFNGWQIADLRGLTKGQGFSGPVKRFGVKLRFHKTEKGQRKVGSIGPWHPARVVFLEFQWRDNLGCLQESIIIKK